MGDSTRINRTILYNHVHGNHRAVMEEDVDSKKIALKIVRIRRRKQDVHVRQYTTSAPMVKIHTGMSKSTEQSVLVRYSLTVLQERSTHRHPDIDIHNPVSLKLELVLLRS